MIRDFMLGWPPSLLALDPEPAKPAGPAPIIRPRLTADDQLKRHALDNAITGKLREPERSILDARQPSHDFRVCFSKTGQMMTNTYRLRAGRIEFWHRFAKHWYTTTRDLVWDDMHPAPADYLNAMPKEAFE